MTAYPEELARIDAPKRLRIWRRDEWALYFDPRTMLSVKVNGSGGFILDRLTEGRSISEIAGLASAQFGVERSEAQAAIEGFVHTLVESGFLGPADAPPVPARTDAGLGFPASVYLHLTDSCNLRCAYCYNSDQRRVSRESRRAAGELGRCLTRGEYERLIERILKLGAKYLVFTGGEPLLRRDALDLVEFTRARRPDVDIAFLTNGTLVTDVVAKRLCASATLVKVSLDGHDAGTHETYRGMGTFGLAVRGIERLVAAKRRSRSPVFIMVVPVLSSSNVRDARALADFALNRLGADGVEGILYQAYGGVPRSLQRIPEFDAWAAAVQDIRDVAVARKRDGEAGPLPPYRMPVRDHCGAGWGEISIGPTGLVYPCQTLHDEDLVAGDVRREDVAEIYRRSPVLARMRAFTVDAIPVCRTCDLRYVCGGGCRALALRVEGALDAHNAVYCPYLERLAVDSIWASCDRAANDAMQACP